MCDEIDKDCVQINSPKHKSKPEYNLVVNKDISSDLSEVANEIKV